MREKDFTVRKELAERLSLIEKTGDFLPLLQGLLDGKMITAHSLDIVGESKLVLKRDCGNCDFGSVQKYLAAKGLAWNVSNKSSVASSRKFEWR